MSQQKTEKPTPRRLRKARKKGQVARSRDLTGAFVVTTGALLLGTIGGGMGLRVARFMAETINGVSDVDEQFVLGHLESGFSVFADILTPFLIGVFTVALVVSLIQVGGGVFSIESILPDWSRLNMGRGFKEILGFRRLAHLIKVVLLVIGLSALTVVLMTLHWQDLAHLPGVDPQTGAAGVGKILLRWLKWIVPVLLAIGIVDYAVQRHSHLERLKMSKDEIKREQREQEGDPVYRGERQRLHRELSQYDLASAVRRATVVVVNPTRLAAALCYDTDQQDAPELVAKGRGHVAEQLRRLAEEYQVPVVENVTLAQSLQHLDVGEQIPPDLYEAVAEILRFVYELAQSEDGAVNAQY